MDMKPFVVTTESISCSALMESLSEKSHGAEIWFFGKVRNHNLGKPVVAVSYDAFVPLAEKVFADLAYEVQAQWGKDIKVQIVHRVGQLRVGDVSVAIGVSARHRPEAYEASRYIIEELKKRAPLWKKEHYIDGETEWLKGHALCAHHHP